MEVAIGQRSGRDRTGHDRKVPERSLEFLRQVMGLFHPSAGRLSIGP